MNIWKTIPNQFETNSLLMKSKRHMRNVRKLGPEQGSASKKKEDFLKLLTKFCVSFANCSLILHINKHWIQFSIYNIVRIVRYQCEIFTEMNILVLMGEDHLKGMRCTLSLLKFRFNSVQTFHNHKIAYLYSFINAVDLK